MALGASIELERVSITLDGNPIVQNVDLSIKAGEFLCLLGPSGCGKSTLLNVIAGFIEAEGTVLVGGKPIRGPGIDRGVVFQSTEALFPWLTVQENVEYGLRIRGIPKKERAEAAQHYLRLVGLSHALTRFPKELSGGMRQRAQIARVLVNEPSVVLMDEPFGALDAQTREVLQQEVDRLRRTNQSTFIFVTHDIWEAITLGDRVATMTAGPRAGVKSIMTIDLPHPRDHADPAAIEVYRELRDGIAVEVDKVLRAQQAA